MSAYAMANEFMDGLATLRRAQGLPAMSINWSAWADKGMGHRYNHNAFLSAVGMSSIEVSQGISLLDKLMSTAATNIIVCKVQWEKFLQVNPEAKRLGFFAHIAKEYAVKENGPINSSFDREQISSAIINVLTLLLELQAAEINPSIPYQNYGVDSIVGIHFVAKLNEVFADVISPMDLYRYPTIQHLVDYIFQAQHNKKAILPATNVEQSESEFIETITHLDATEISRLIDDELNQIDYLE